MIKRFLKTFPEILPEETKIGTVLSSFGKDLDIRISKSEGEEDWEVSIIKDKNFCYMCEDGDQKTFFGSGSIANIIEKYLTEGLK